MKQAFLCWISGISLAFAFGAPESVASEKFESAWYDASSPVPVLHVEGSIEEVARAHGALLGRHPNAPEFHETLDYFAHAVEHRLERNALLAGSPALQGLALWAYRHFVRNLMMDYVPDRYRAAYGEFAKAAGIPEEQVFDALALPDAALRLVSLFYPLELAPPLPPSFGCTSIVWNSGPSSVLHGRNLDYDGVGYWDKHPLILHVIPNEGLAYVAVTALGIHAPGITAFNEAGLTLAVHQLTVTDTQATGTPVAVISAEVIRSARSIDDAIAIIRAFPRAGGWAYVLSQGRDRAVVEATASEVAIRRASEAFFFQTNHVSSPALASRQIFYSPGSWIDSFTRAGRLARLESQGLTRGWATPERLAPMLGLGTVEGESSPPRRVAGGTVAKLDNIQSVIMDATHRRLWVAVGTDKRAPNEATYIEYRWSDLRAADEPEVTGAEVSLVPEDAIGASGEKLRELLRQAVNQKSAAAHPEHRRQLLAEYGKLFAEHAKTSPALPGRWPGVYLHVWEELRAADGEALSTAALEQLLHELDVALKDADLSTANFATELGRTVARHRQALGRFTRARLLDLLGRRSEALLDYFMVQKTATFERLRAAADRGLRSPFDWKMARKLAIDWGGIDLYQY